MPSSEWVEFAVGLGSNLGDRAAIIRAAAARLGATPGVADVRLSPLYETAPYGYVEQPAFLNAALAGKTRLGPIQLLVVLKHLEHALGRVARFHWGPREIDLDLLLYGDRQISRRGLTVPHPGLFQRAFVLAPLRDVYPGLRTPSGESIDLVLERLRPEQPMELFEGR
jgi:2-amino-4-hydroxy-6-hydroxymethyldihydropteridine diphosphokinase